MDALAADDRVNHEEETLIKTHAVLVKRIAHHLMGRLPPSVQLEDLIQAGMLGLLEAAKNYDATRGASFETYAGIRIRGYILDEVRRNDWVPRSVYRNARMISEAVKKLEHRLCREAKDHEIAKELDLNLEDYHELLKDAAGSQLQSLDDLGLKEDILPLEINNDRNEPHQQVLQKDFMHHIAQIIDGLPKNEKLVLSLYYEQDLNLKEIGDVLEVSESRISQIHTQAMIRIKSRLPE